MTGRWVLDSSPSHGLKDIGKCAARDALASPIDLPSAFDRFVGGYL
jgi:hypothetical protein